MSIMITIRIYRSDMQIPKPEKRYINEEYLDHVRMQPCLGCGQVPSNPHHVRWAGPCGWGTKTSDTFTIPLCRKCHDHIHNDQRAIEREDILIQMVESLSDFIKLKFPPTGKGKDGQL
jgi:hypothetical protein